MSVSERHVLDPTERLSEILFGIIMVLSFTGSVSVATAGREEVRTVLAQAVSCNLAWGIVDAVMYLLTALISRAREQPGEARLTGRDARGAVGVFLLVFLSTLPVVVPFLLFRNAFLALRVSNGVALAMLFAGGYSLGRQSGLPPWRLGLWVMAVGVALVAVTMALGG
jgi:VIT1/CCC1 family predicted Fe2+/Mn2+ transporter